MSELRSNRGARLALGTAQFGLSYGIANRSGQVGAREAGAILQYAGSHGVSTLDTAIAYGDSERRLGEVGVDGWRVVSKLPAIPEGCSDVAQWVEDTAVQSLQRLRLAFLHGLLLHQPHQLLGPYGRDLYEALRRLKREGLIRKIGVSVYEPAEIEGLSQFPLDLIQIPFNVLDRRLLTSGCMSHLHDQGTELHVRSVFLQGLLLMPPQGRPAKFARWQSVWNRWDNWLHGAGLTPLQACLRYVMQFTQIDRIVVGVDSSRQLAEILDAADGAVPAIPEEFSSTDADLVNPAKWAALTH